MPTRWYREKKREHYYRKAKEKGYRSRSAFKLKQIQDKYKIIEEGDIVVDLGSFPGGWSQVAKEIVVNGKVIAIDKQPMGFIKGVRFIRGDATDEATIDEIKKIAGEADVIISDMSPNISGNYSLDQARSVWLGETALHLAKKLLKRDGNFLCKVFEGEDYPIFLEKVRSIFRMVDVFVPKASRKSSSELYIIGKGFKE